MIESGASGDQPGTCTFADACRYTIGITYCLPTVIIGSPSRRIGVSVVPWNIQPSRSISKLAGAAGALARDHNNEFTCRVMARGMYPSPAATSSGEAGSLRSEVT